MINKIEEIVRKVAKSNEAQTIYSSAKELHLKIFKNDRDFSNIQIMYLNYLNFYATLFMDIYLKEIDEKVLEDNIYEDAYFYYKSKVSEKNREKSIDIGNIKRGYNTKIGKEKIVKSQWNFRRNRNKC